MAVAVRGPVRSRGAEVCRRGAGRGAGGCAAARGGQGCGGYRAAGAAGCQGLVAGRGGEAHLRQAGRARQHPAVRSPPR